MKDKTLPKISEAEYFKLFKEKERDNEKILYYSLVIKGKGGFDWSLAPNPERVEQSIFKSLPPSLGTDILNALERQIRLEEFTLRLPSNQLPVLVSEGDSWFQFPIIIDEVIDQLKEKYLILSLGAAGDTLDNMVYGNRGTGEYLRVLKANKNIVRGFLFSGGGNDIIGEDPETEESSLLAILKNYSAEFATNPFALINFGVLAAKIVELERGYKNMIASIREEPGLESLPIFLHGYDYVFPYPWNEAGEDPRNPFYTKNDQWLGSAFHAKEFPKTPLRREIIKILIDAFNDMLSQVAGDSSETKVYIINCRGAMPDVADWRDEIHGTNEGFSKVAKRFDDVISSVFNS